MSEPIIPQGNPLRLPHTLRGGAVTAASSIAALLLMAHQGQLRIGVPLGFVFIAIATIGVLDLLGSFEDPATNTTSRVTLAQLTPCLVRAAVSFALFVAAMMGAASGAASQSLWGAVVTLTFVGLVSSIFTVGERLGPWATDEDGLPRPLWKRHGFWLMVLSGLLYLPMLGSYSLWDPWETHYGEVAREILSRDDWISLWWAQDGWFWSKPILNFWIQSLAMATGGVDFRPDGMLQGVGGATAHPEWIVRLPNVLLTLVGSYFLYKGVARVFGRRAGLMGGIALSTMPQWYFLAHQTMADMPYVAPMTASMGLLLIGLHTAEDDRVKLYEVTAGTRTIRLSAFHLVVGSVLLLAIPQILYLFTRNLEWITSGVGGHGLRPHWDEFRSGSPGNCGLPGNEACTGQVPASVPKQLLDPATFQAGLMRAFMGFEPFVQAALWLGILIGILYINHGERRTQRLIYLAAWMFAAVATMAKGPVGVILPMVCAFAYVCARKRWSEMLRFEIVSGILILGAVALPWYVAMFVRHGPPFTDRLIFHDMFNRAFAHVHDTNEGDDTSFRFYLWQLGYALFPWSGLAPLGLTYWLRRPDNADQGRGDVSVFLAMWFLFAFALFTFMGTKFHHYILPALPPIAMLTGIVLDDLLGRNFAPRIKGFWGLVGPIAGLTIGLGIIVGGLSCFWAGSSFQGERIAGEVPGVSFSVVGLLLLVVGGTMKVLSLSYFTPKEPAAPELQERRLAHESIMVGAATVVSGFLLVLVGKDLVMKIGPNDSEGAIRFLHLFTYNYRRPWPESLDFSAPLLAFIVASALASMALCIRRFRQQIVVVWMSLSFVWALWGLDVYMIKTAPHWGQHELIETYYQRRANPHEMLIAYQMNWKGENFYTGNHVPAFVSTGTNFTNWMKKKRDEGTRVMFFITEHARIGGLRNEVGAKSYEELSTKAGCNKFILVRAEL